MKPIAIRPEATGIERMPLWGEQKPMMIEVSDHLIDLLQQKLRLRVSRGMGGFLAPGHRLRVTRGVAKRMDRTLYDGLDFQLENTFWKLDAS